MSVFSTFLIRLLLVAAGLLFAASLAVVFVLLLALWTVRAAWARLTGRPVMAFSVGMDPRRGFERMYRQAGQRSRAARADSFRRGRRGDDVTDVEPRGG